MKQMLVLTLKQEDVGEKNRKKYMENKTNPFSFNPRNNKVAKSNKDLSQLTKSFPSQATITQWQRQCKPQITHKSQGSGHNTREKNQS